MKFHFLTFLLFPFSLLSQTPFPPLPPVFQDDLIPRVDINMPPDSLQKMLVPGSEYHWHATFIFDSGSLVDTLENVGVKIRGNTSVGAAKKSFRVSFNTYESGRKWQGLEKLNLLGNHNDPVVARAKISWDLLRRMGIPAPRSNHVRLYFNGDYRGLYVNVEHVDEEFVQLRFGNNEGNLYKCLWPADLAFKGGDPDVYKQEFGGRRAYELMTNEAADDYSDLAHFITVLNQTPTADLPCELEKVFNVDNYLKIIAFDLLDGNWDNAIYNKNNFYLYQNLATGKFEYVPYDLDNTLGIDWLNVDWVNLNIYAWAHPSEPRPIYKRLLAVPEYKDRFSFYLGEYLQTVFHPDSVFPYLDSLKTLISPAAQTDPFRPLDYGFTFQDFEEGWESSLPFFHTDEGVKSYVQGRWASAVQQLVTGDIAPVFRQASHQFLPGETGVQFTAAAFDDNLTTGIKICYRWNGQAQICLDLLDDGFHSDGAKNDEIFGNNLDFVGQTGKFEYFFQATDNAGQQSRQPTCGWRVIYAGAAAKPLILNEFMASNSQVYPDDAGEFEDWIEIFNPGSVPFSLQNFYLTDNENQPGKWKMPNVYIPAQGYGVFWADDDASHGARHTNFKLSADGEFLAIFEKVGDSFSLVDSYIFGEQSDDQAVGRLPNGTGDFQPVSPTPGAANQLTPVFEQAGGTGLNIKTTPNPAASRLKIFLENEGENLSAVELL
ncbi:MAG: CotH kinase family protein, partial [Bacteroidota bacterium]